MTFTKRPGLIMQAILWILVGALGIYFVKNIRNFISFGIDLAGGTYLTLKVHTKEALKNDLLEYSMNFTNALKKQGKNAPISNKVTGSEAKLIFKTKNDADVAYDIISNIIESNKNNQLKISKDSTDPNNIIIEFTPSAVKDLSREAIQGNINILQSRLDQMGVGEIMVAQQGKEHILIELPDIQDIEKAKKKIGTTALLEIKPIEDHAISKEKMIEDYDGDLPEGTIIVPDKDPSKGVYLVPEYAEITGKMLQNAQMEVVEGHLQQGYKSPYAVKITFKSDSVDKWADLTGRVAQGKMTGENMGMIAMILDNKVISAAGVQQALNDPVAILSGDFTAQEATDLAMLLKSGAFTAKVSFSQERTIGPSLGKELAQQGLIACGVALVLLLLLSILFYKTSGILAFIVLIYNLLLILFSLWYFGATLTLPGIAGMVLTLGMAIDSSILIYERIKEELSTGMNMKQAVQLGFNGALTVILDANITTFIVALVLYFLASGPMQGFALTMMIGIISTLISGIILLKFLFKLLFSLGIQKIKI